MTVMKAVEWLIVRVISYLRDGGGGVVISLQNSFNCFNRQIFNIWVLKWLRFVKGMNEVYEVYEVYEVLRLGC